MIKYKSIIAIVICMCSFTACGQQPPSPNNKTNETQQNNISMDTTKLINSTVKQVFEAWQNGDKETFVLLHGRCKTI